MPSTLILLRHGESEWNRANLFTGWVDSDLTPVGEEQARQAGQAMVDAGVAPTIVHTSLQARAIRTANLALDVMGRLWLPVRRSWRLNERHYGDLTGKDKRQTVAEFGEDQVALWRRSYDVPPPPIGPGNPHNPNGNPAWAHLPAELIPASECLKDVVARALPWFYDRIVPDLAAGEVVLVAAHGNSLRALVKHLDGISEADIVAVNLPTGVPLRYDLDDRLRPVDARPPLERALGDPAAVASAAAAVAAQTGRAQGMIDHLGIQCSDVPAAAAFYDTVLAPLGGARILDYGVAIGYGFPGHPNFWIGELADGVNRPIHVCFQASDRAAVRAFFDAAVGAGAEVLHQPRIWPEYHPNYYGAFVRDPDGNNVEACCHSPE